MTVIINGSSGITNVNGTAAAPAETGTTSTNTGIFFPAANTLGFSTSGTEVGRFDSSGNLCLATTAALVTSANRGNMTIGGSAGSILFLGTGSTTGGYVYFEQATSGMEIWNGANGYTRFGTNNAERARIDSSGNLLVGTTNTSSSAGNGFKLNTNTDKPSLLLVGNSAGTSVYPMIVYSSASSSNKFYMDYAGSLFAVSTTITAISDQRLKENIQDIDVGLDAVMALRPRKFDWKAGKGKDKKGDRGWIAQEFEKVFPDMIGTWLDPAPEGEEPYKAVNADLIPVLVKAIQEQQALIQTLTERITALESK